MNATGQKTILASPLEWGLGHTVRLVPLIEAALSQGCRVILASDGRSLNFLRNRFPDLPWVRMPFYPIRYPDDSRFFRKLMPQVPGILRTIHQNRKQLAGLVREWCVDLIISDHRYGMTYPGVTSVFITNQLWLKAPKGLGWTEPLVYRLHVWYLRKFTHIWLPDLPGCPNISGIQTHPPGMPRRAEYVGLISRFGNMVPVPPREQEPFDILGLLSGPEPQRSMLERILIDQSNDSGIRTVILRGLPPDDPFSGPDEETTGSVRLISHLPDPQLLWYVKQAGRIICRPGNSTVSDLISLGKTALLVPTPGQTEQEYVAEHLAAQGWFEVCRQEDLGRESKAKGRRQKAEGKEKGKRKKEKVIYV